MRYLLILGAFVLALNSAYCQQPKTIVNACLVAYNQKNIVAMPANASPEILSLSVSVYPLENNRIMITGYHPEQACELCTMVVASCKA